MAFIENFSSSEYNACKQGDYVLLVYLNSSHPYVYRKYDFLTRTLFIDSGESAAGVICLPFSQVDRESLIFLRNLLIEKGGNPPALPEEITGNTNSKGESWIRMGDMAVAQVGTYPEIQRKLTQIFNFTTRQMTASNENLKTFQETSTAPISFDDLPTVIVEKAFDKFTEAGGQADKGFVLRGKASLPKQKLN